MERCRQISVCVCSLQIYCYYAQVDSFARTLLDRRLQLIVPALASSLFDSAIALDGPDQEESTEAAGCI